MKKIYSIVLMATALLIGTNVWANSVFDGLADTQGENTISVTIGGVTKYASSLQTAVNAVDAGETAKITLLATQKLSAPVIIPQVTGTVTDEEKVANRARQIITLDLNGKNIEPGTGYIGAAFLLFKGELNLTGAGNVIRSGNSAGSYGNLSSAAIVVLGADGDKRSGQVDRSKQEWSTLIIGKDVNVQGLGQWVKNPGKANEENRGAYGICINPFNLGTSSGIGVANLVAKDNMGYYTYYTASTNPKAVDKMWWNGTGASAFGVKIMISGTVYGLYRGINVQGNINQAPEAAEGHTARTKDVYPFYDRNYPYVKVEAGAKVYCSDGKDYQLESGNGGIYGGGWVVYDIAGDVYGQTGVYLKAGDAAVTDNGHVYSTSEQNATNGNYGGNVAGNGIFISSASNYAGGTNVSIEDNAKIEGNGGAAIIDVLADNAHGNSTVENIEIKGGTIVGGAEGAIVITEATAGAGAATVYDVNLEGNTNVVAGTTGGLLDLLPEDEHGDANAYVTTTVDEKGHTVLVVTSGASAEPAAVADNFDINAFTMGDVNLSADGLTKKDQVFNSSSVDKLEIGTLMMNNTTTPVSLTIAAGHTIIAQKVMMSAKAQIIVEPGATLIVTGHSGINTFTSDNIILQANNNAQATFLFNPAVEANSNPYATVVMTAKQIGKSGSSYYWHRFAMPIQHATGWTKEGNLSGTSYPTYLYGWDYATNDWQKLPGGVSDMVPFAGYTLTLASDEIPGVTELQDVRYIFKGNLLGNTNNALNFQRSGFHFFSNSYTGHISILNLISQITSDSQLEHTAWVWNPTNQRYEDVPLASLSEDPDFFDDYQKEVAPMHTFILKQATGSVNSTALNYASAVWGNPRYDGIRPAAQQSSAPARYTTSNNIASMSVVISAANGQSDIVRFVENSNRSDAFDNGYDASKYMNENTINTFATINGENLGTVATNNLEGKKLNFTTNNEVSYTLSFAKVNGNEYAIRDNITGSVIAIEEGNKYEFAAQPNSTIEGRFEIVNANKVATAIENAEVKSNVKGIYTVTGMYMGENFDVLPAGVYVVDGVKIVK